MGIGFIASKRLQIAQQRQTGYKHCYMQSVLICNVDWSLTCFWTSEPQLFVLASSQPHHP